MKYGPSLFPNRKVFVVIGISLFADVFKDTTPEGIMFRSTTWENICSLGNHPQLWRYFKWKREHTRVVNHRFHGSPKKRAPTEPEHSTVEEGMELINTITVQHQGNQRQVLLFVGDLADLPEAEAVDVLIVSAFPDDYTPTSSSMIGALARAGVSVADLARNKEVDLRNFSSCWLSRQLNQPGINFRRILCFEPGYRGRASEVVGDIFRSIVPFTTGNPPISQIAIPLVASGALGESAEVMLEVLADASVHWLSVGLPLDRIKIVIRTSNDSPSLRETFDRVKQRQAKSESDQQRQPFRFDAFVSYCQKNKEAVDAFVKELQIRRPELRVFVDRLELHPGAAWQQHIFDSIDQSRKVICALSPDYLASKICKEEFNIALFRHRESSEGVLLPVYLYSAELPTYMKLYHYEDAREGDPVKIAKSAERLLGQL